MFSAKVSSSSGENLTPACLMGDGGVFNVMFSLGGRPGVLYTCLSRVYLRSTWKDFASN